MSGAREQTTVNRTLGTQSVSSSAPPPPGWGGWAFLGAFPAPWRSHPQRRREGRWGKGLAACLKWRCEGGPEVGCTQAS